MNLLVTAGNTLTPIDQVRAITNIFTGRTGAAIALTAYQRGHRVTLLTSHPERIGELPDTPDHFDAGRWRLFTYRTFDELAALMEEQIKGSSLDAVVHSAAVSDYRCEGIYAPADRTGFETQTQRWLSSDDAKPHLTDRAAGKVKSDEPELWLRLVRTPKLVDKIRADWGFKKLLVKFKLEVGKTEEELLAIAERSRQQSEADLMVANTLEDAGRLAFVGPVSGLYERASRQELAGRLIMLLEMSLRQACSGKTSDDT